MPILCGLEVLMSPSETGRFNLQRVQTCIAINIYILYFVSSKKYFEHGQQYDHLVINNSQSLESCDSSSIWTTGW